MATPDRQPTPAATPAASTAPRDGASGSRRTQFILWGAVALTLLLGYLDLIRGGITISAILLVLAYCVLIPLAIIKR